MGNAGSYLNKHAYCKYRIPGNEGRKAVSRFEFRRYPSLSSLFQKSLKFPGCRCSATPGQERMAPPLELANGLGLGRPLTE